MTQSALERTFLTWWMAFGDRDDMPDEEHMFHPTRKWRLDFAWPDAMVSVEMQGMAGKSGKSGHTTWKGYANDCDKINAAQELGWIVLQYTREHTSNRDARHMINQVMNVLEIRRRNV